MGDILVLLSCCDHKEKGGSSLYNYNDSILPIFHEKIRLRVLQKRYAIFRLIENSRIRDSVRAGGDRAANPYNLKLNNGPDLSSDFPTNQPVNNLYLPAYRRYSGRFFEAVGVDNFEKAILEERHTLLLSSMYGLITLAEPIQSYGCYLGDDIIASTSEIFLMPPTKGKMKVKDLWIENNVSLIYESLVQYIEYHNYNNNHEIKSIIDLLSEYYYQIPFQWNERLYKWLKKKNIKVFHRHVTGLREPEFLPFLGLYYKHEIIEKGDSYVTPEYGRPLRFPYISTSKMSDVTLSFEEVIITPESRFQEKLIKKLTSEVWSMLDQLTMRELIRGERLYELTNDWSLGDPDEPAERILHFFVAVENELKCIFGKIRKGSGQIGFGSIGEYCYNLKIGQLKDKIPLNDKKLICDKLEEFTLIRNKMPHIKEAYRRHFERARELIFAEDGILRQLMRFKKK